MGIEVLIGAAIIGTLGSAVYANEAADAQRDAARIQQKQAKLKARRERVEQIRSTRIATAKAQLAAESQGAADSSGAQGGVGSIISQLGSNLGFSIQMEGMSDQASAELAQASRESNTAGLFQAGANIAMSGISMTGGTKTQAPKKPAPVVFK